MKYPNNNITSYLYLGKVYDLKMKNNSWFLMIVVHLPTKNDANVVGQILEKYKEKVARSASLNLATFPFYFFRVCSTTEASSSVNTCTIIIKTPNTIKI